MFKNLFSPILINKTEIRNRIVYPSMGLLYSYDGKINDRYTNYFLEKARGETGVVTVGPVGVDFLGSGSIMLSLMEDNAIPAFRTLASLIKKEGARAWIQLFHAGAYTHPMLIGDQTPVAPSAVYSRYSKTTPREMTIDEIKQVQEAFVNAAGRAQEAGFDGIEILASGGYLITQFLSPAKNLRTDEYGGSFENRVRFPRELIELTRNRLGPEFPLTIRMAGNDFVTGSNTDLETPEFAKIYEKAGVDAISVTGGWHETNVPQLPACLPRAGFAFLAYNIKKEVSVPVIASNRISTPDAAEDLLRDGYADMVSIGRGLIADPYWGSKALEGRPEEIRPCIACLQGCMDGIMSGQPVSCVTNPIAGFEGAREIEKSSSPKTVMVVGAGPAGLEAAVTATRAGHNVELYEKDDDIGGQIWIASAPPHKEEFLELIRYYRAMLKKYNINPHLNKEVDIALIKERNPDYLILAEGGEPLTPPIEGTDDPCVISAWELLKENPSLGKEVAIIGGGSVGLETALFVATKGTITPEVLHFLLAYEAESVERLRELMFKGNSNVTVFEMLPKAGKDVGKSTKWVLMSDLHRFGVMIKTSAKVVSISNGILTYEKDGQEQHRQFDNIIIASGSKSVQRLSSEIKKLGIPFSTIGDCVEPRKIDSAIHEGFLSALEI